LTDALGHEMAGKFPKGIRFPTAVLERSKAGGPLAREENSGELTETLKQVGGYTSPDWPFADCLAPPVPFNKDQWYVPWPMEARLWPTPPRMGGGAAKIPMKQVNDEELLVAYAFDYMAVHAAIRGVIFITARGPRWPCVVGLSSFTT
jgi:hypothetical protein